MENQEIQNNSGHSIKWGIILGVISILLTLIIYIIDVTMLIAGWFTGLTLILSIAIVFYASINYRKELGGFMSFGQAFLHAFVLLAISGLLGLLFQYLLFNVIDPEAARVLGEVQMEKAMAMMETLGAASNAEAMDQMAKGFENQYGFGTLMKGYAFILVVYAIFALIVGAITKKKNKELDF